MPAPSWTDAPWSAGIAEPFRSDGEFWRGLAASADALIGLAAAIGVAAVLALLGHPAFALLPFAAPAVLAVRAAVVSRSSSRRSQAAFEHRRAWRDAERAAVAASFAQALCRPRRSHGT